MQLDGVYAHMHVRHRQPGIVDLGPQARNLAGGGGMCGTALRRRDRRVQKVGQL